MKKVSNFRLSSSVYQVFLKNFNMQRFYLHLQQDGKEENEGNISPHTANELFTGLNVWRSIEVCRQCLHQMCIYSHIQHIKMCWLIVAFSYFLHKTWCYIFNNHKTIGVVLCCDAVDDDYGICFLLIVRFLQANFCLDN